MILKVEMLLDANEIVRPKDISALLNQVFKDNSHLAKLIICETHSNERQYQWEWYTNETHL